MSQTTFWIYLLTGMARDTQIIAALMAVVLVVALVPWDEIWRRTGRRKGRGQR